MNANLADNFNHIKANYVHNMEDITNYHIIVIIILLNLNRLI